MVIDRARSISRPADVSSSQQACQRKLPGDAMVGCGSAGQCSVVWRGWETYHNDPGGDAAVHRLQIVHHKPAQRRPSSDSRCRRFSQLGH